MLECLTSRQTAKTFVLDPENNLLVIRRSLWAIYRRGQYDLPGGGIHAGETALQAAFREAEEECGLVLPRSSMRRLVGMGKRTFYVDYIDEVMPHIELSREHNKYQWPHISEANTLLTHPPQARALELLQQSDYLRNVVEIPRPRHPAIMPALAARFAS